MKLHSLRNHPLITGTLMLTLTGLLSRVIGFFYRIFLSQTIGAEGMGIYQLTFPIHVLTISLTSSAIQTAISRFVAQAASARSTPGFEKTRSRSQPNESCYLTAGLMLSLSLSFFCTIFLYQSAEFLAVHILEEPRCTVLLQILSLTIPTGAIHACINGYYYGLKKTFVPATSQLVEQLVRVLSVWLFFEISMEKYQSISLSLIVWGMVAGEIAAVLFSVSFLRRGKSRGSRLLGVKQIFFMSFPLSANRVLVNILQSVEAVMIPGQLRSYGYSASEALSVYGVFSGMAMPMVLFPSVLTNSLSVMLLPTIAEAQQKKNHSYIYMAVKKACFYCLSLGFGCTLLFLLLGKWMGNFLFDSELAGTFIVILGWICPFLYLSTTLNSILNGLGRTTATFLLNVSGLIIRISFVIFIIPLAGIKAYLWGLLVSQIVMAFGALLMIVKKRKSVSQA